ncbi:MAG TPA: hypothetical protein VGC80_07450, partial [Acetobacteraceae bacterium]
VGLNLHPHGLAGRAAAALTLAPDLSLSIRRVRAMHFPQALFWFEAEFVADQKEQEVLCVGMDLHYGRQVRHTEALLQPDRLAEAPVEPLPEAPHEGLRAAYFASRERAARTVGALANTRKRELAVRVQKQSARMKRYYEQFRRELEEQSHRAGQDAAKYAARVEALGREEQLRLAELEAKTALRVRLRVLALLLVRQPKLLLQASLAARDGRSGSFDGVWDPLTESVEAVRCPGCGQPTYNLALDRSGAVACPACAAARRPKH